MTQTMDLPGEIWNEIMGQEYDAKLTGHPLGPQGIPVCSVAWDNGTAGEQ